MSCSLFGFLGLLFVWGFVVFLFYFCVPIVPPSFINTVAVASQAQAADVSSLEQIFTSRQVGKVSSFLLQALASASVPEFRIHQSPIHHKGN